MITNFPGGDPTTRDCGTFTNSVKNLWEMVLPGDFLKQESDPIKLNFLHICHSNFFITN